MENENVTNVQAGEQQAEQGQTGQEQQRGDEKGTFTEEQLNKKLQSATDKVRTEYSKKMKDLESKIKELTPEQKTKEQIELENRVKSLEDKEKQLQEKELQLKISKTLNDNGLPLQLTNYLKIEGVEDVESYLGEVKEILGQHLTNNTLNSSFKPQGHKETKDSITIEQFNKMGYMERMKLYTSNKELYKKLNSNDK